MRFPLRRPIQSWTRRAVAVALSVTAFGTASLAQGSKPVPQPGKNPIVQAPPKIAPPPPTALLSGRVTSVADGKPLVRARVVVSADEIFECPPGTPPGQTENCQRYNRVQNTDKDGRWSVDKLPPGTTYVITVSKTGFAARAFGETPPAVVPTYVVLKDGEKREDIDIQLVPQTFMAGTLFDEDQTPFAGALVEALRAVYDKGQRSFVTAADCVTDDRGRFRLFGLAPGQYYITAFDPAYSRVGDPLGQLFYGPTFYPGTVYQDDAVRITLDPGVPREGLEFKLQIIRPARVTGKITAPGLQLLSGAVNMGPSRSVRSASFAISEADIKPSGVFQFANVLAERYVIRARAAVEINGVSHFALWTVPVEGQDITDIDMVVAPGAIVKGRVTWESKMSQPPADKSGIFVRAPMTDGSAFGDALTGTIESDHTFLINGAMTGVHYIRVDGLPDPWRLKRVLWRGADITDIPLPVESLQIVDGLEVILTDVFTTLSGLASIAADDLAQGYAVIAFSTSRLHWQPNSRYVKITYLDDRGRYVFRGLPPAEYNVVLTRGVDESDLTSNEILERLARNSATIRLGEGERRRQDLQTPIIKR